jgi:uncharacterized RDD family membrane protein YckC
MKLEDYLDYKPVTPLPDEKPEKEHWIIEAIATLIAGLIAVLVCIPAFLLLCFGVDPLGIKKNKLE